MFYEKEQKLQNMAYSSSKMSPNVIFLMQNFFQSMASWKVSTLKSNALYLLQIKILRVAFF